MHCSRRKQIRVHEPYSTRNFDSQFSQNKLIQTCQFNDNFLSRTPIVSLISSKERGIDSLFDNSKGFQTHFRLTKAQSVWSRSQKNESQKTQQSSKISVEKSKKTFSQRCYEFLHVKPSNLEDCRKTCQTKSRLLRRYSLQTQKLRQLSQSHLKKKQQNQPNQQQKERRLYKTTLMLSRPNSFNLINSKDTHKSYKRNSAGKILQQQWKDLCPWPQMDSQDFYF